MTCMVKDNACGELLRLITYQNVRCVGRAWEIVGVAKRQKPTRKKCQYLDQEGQVDVLALGRDTRSLLGLALLVLLQIDTHTC